MMCSFLMPDGRTREVALHGREAGMEEWPGWPRRELSDEAAVAYALMHSSSFSRSGRPERCQALRIHDEASAGRLSSSRGGSRLDAWVPRDRVSRRARARAEHVRVRNGRADLAHHFPLQRGRRRQHPRRHTDIAACHDERPRIRELTQEAPRKKRGANGVVDREMCKRRERRIGYGGDPFRVLATCLQPSVRAGRSCRALRPTPASAVAVRRGPPWSCSR